MRYNEKGEIVYVDDAARRKERAELETWVKPTVHVQIA